MAIRQLYPTEVDSEGWPTFKLSFSYEAGHVGREMRWFAYYDKLPGYLGIGSTQENALANLRGDLLGAPVCIIERARRPSVDARRKLDYIIKQAGGVDAPSEAFRTEYGSLGVSSRDIYNVIKPMRQNRNAWREMADRCSAAGMILEDPFSDDAIESTINLRSGSGEYDSRWGKSLYWRNCITSFLIKNGLSWRSQKQTNAVEMLNKRMKH